MLKHPVLQLRGLCRVIRRDTQHQSGTLRFDFSDRKMRYNCSQLWACMFLLPAIFRWALADHMSALQKIGTLMPRHEAGAVDLLFQNVVRD